MGNWKNPSRRLALFFMFRVLFFKMSSLNIYKLSITINIVPNDAERSFYITLGLKEGFLMEMSSRKCNSMQLFL